MNYCEHCGLLCFDYYMVRNLVWRKAWPINLPQRDVHLHLACVEERIKRDLTIDDFDTDLPVNLMIVFGYKMGRIQGHLESI